MYDRSVKDPRGFWSDMARSQLTWFRPFSDDQVLNGTFQEGNVRWFADGQLNISYNCIDRHVAAGRGDQIAIIHEGDEPGQSRTVTYSQLLSEVCRVANVLTAAGVKKGDFVTIYLPMMIDIAFVMLACTRIGAPHSVVFAGFSAESLRDRILDAASPWVITANEGRRGGRGIPLKATTDAAVRDCPCVKKVFVYARTEAAVPMGPLDVAMEPLLKAARPFCPAVTMDAEDLSFLLYTSGSTGKPKGIAHSTGGYLVGASTAHKYIFDMRPGDVYACVADAGWITGHSFMVYGPLCNGATTLMFESTPLYPDASRYWEMVEKWKITQFYTAPTAIRALMRFGEAPVRKHDLTSLRVLGSVGEPINPEAWRWYHDVVGQGRCSVVDTWWMTETGAIMITGLPGATPMRPGSASLPFFGVVPQLRLPEGRDSSRVVEGNDVSGALCIAAPWPSMARTVWGDHERFQQTYFTTFPGTFFTGDGAIRDGDGYYWVTGRIDDVMNVSGHRIGSAEVESALVGHAGVAEAAVVGFPHDVKGQGIACFVTLKAGQPESDGVVAELRGQVRSVIGAFATPDLIVIAPGLPKTRSGKIMRRILRKIVSGHTSDAELGDISTLAEPGVVAELVTRVAAATAPKPAAAAAASGGAGRA